MSEIATDKKVIITNALLCFPYLWEPNTYNPADPKYGAVFNLGQNPDQQLVAALKAACAAAAREKFGDKLNNPAFVQSMKTPFKDGGNFLKNKPLEGFAIGDFCITATSKNQPNVVDQRVQPILDKKLVYAGCIVNASVVAFAYDNKSQGVGLGLQNIQLVRQGKSLGGTASAPSEDFKPLADTGTASVAGDAGGLFGSAGTGQAVNPFA